MDIGGHVIDPGESQRFQKGDLIMSTGTVGYSDGCSYQSHALVQPAEALAVSNYIKLARKSSSSTSSCN
ncbi:hypothetical protein FOXYSP1_04342 [Fusarium oxysporum f. sp. phaseoli]